MLERSPTRGARAGPHRAIRTPRRDRSLSALLPERMLQFRLCQFVDGRRGTPRGQPSLSSRLRIFDPVNLLLQTVQDAETHFGQKATMAPNLLGMVEQGERAYGFLTGDMNEGFAVTVGAFNGRIRYAAFNKRTGEAWSEGDLRAALMQIGPFSNWS